MNTETEFKIRARRGDISLDPDSIKLYAYKRGRGGSFAAQKLELKQIERGECLIPFLSIELNEAQMLMNDLWDCGLRPSEGTGSAGAMKAVQNHLEDMRKIVFKKLGI